MKVFQGSNGTVHVDDQPLLLRAHLSADEPQAVDWGRGSRNTCRQHLALAILSECLGDETARTGHKSFQFAVINDLPKDFWMLTEEDVQRWHYQWKIHRSLAESSSEANNSRQPKEELVLPENIRYGSSAMRRNNPTFHGRQYPLGMIAGMLLLAASSLPLLLFGLFIVGGICAVVAGVLLAALASALLACLFFYCPHCRRHFALTYQRGSDVEGWRCVHCDQLARRNHD